MTAVIMEHLDIVKELCQDSRYGPSLVNKKDSRGFTALLMAVLMGHLDIVKELDKEGTDFSTRYYGATLIEVATEKKRRTFLEGNAAVLEYLIQRPKVDSLKVIAAHNIARYVKNKAGVEALEIPVTVRQFLAGFVDDEENLDQSGRRTTDGLVANRRATIQPTDGLLHLRLKIDHFLGI